MVNIALPKGRLGEKAYALMAAAGYPCPGVMDNGRKLIFENEALGVRYYWVKPSDVAVYVERGAADIGIVGSDVLLEQRSDVYELLDLGIGACRLAVAAPVDFVEDPAATLRVATKYPVVARQYYAQRSRRIDVIYLNGSVELAPIVGLSDVIVDIVETGATLKENNLEPRETIAQVSARLIANKSAMKFLGDAMTGIRTGLIKELKKDAACV